MQRSGPSLIKQVSRTNRDMKGKILAIRRETINLWERRAPLAPSQVAVLVKSGVKVLVQPSNRRSYTADQYARAGAIIQEDVSEAPLIIGVKTVPLDRECLIPNKTYAFFSHTIKAQPSNMTLLDAVIERNIRLIDYEKILDERGQRLVAFGQYAGICGMINILHGIGIRLLALGHHTPFMHIAPAHNYRSVSQAKQVLREVGYEIALGNMPKSIGPLIFVFTGSGNVSQGAQDMFYDLPFEFVQPEHLEDVSKNGSTNKVYGCVASRSDHLQRKSDGGFDPEEYDSFPERYISTFSHKIAPYASVIVNGIYWAPNSPRLLSIQNARHLLSPKPLPGVFSEPGCPSLPHKLIAICDISADPGGSIEFMKECTTIDKPFCLYDAEENTTNEKFDGPGVLICSIDNMPAQMPREATEFFGTCLLPHISDMLLSDATKPFDAFNVSPAVKNAVIASNGALTPNFQYIAQLRDAKRAQLLAKQKTASAKKSVLVLGAGYVVPPLVEYLTRDGDIKVTIASNMKHETMSIADRYKNVTPDILDIVNEADRVEELIAQHDVVVSMLPYKYHLDILKLCIKKQVNLVTASYCTNEIKALHDQISAAGIIAFMEIGLDPGIDHMLSMDCFDEVKQDGGRIISYKSYCGGLPAPEYSDNPLRYKFSWSPEAALVNAVKSSKFIEQGKIMEIAEGGDLLLHAKPESILPGFNLEMYPNRDSTLYTELYGIDNPTTFMRGTLRYAGYSDAVWALIQLNLFSTKPHKLLHQEGPDITWKEYIANEMKMKSDIFTGTLKDAVFERLGKDRFKFDCIEQLGLFENVAIEKRYTPIATLSHYLSKRLAYGPGERDVIIMSHEIGVRWPDGTNEQRDIRLVVYGEPNGFMAMAKTVGIPTGIATKMVLNGEIETKGIVLPLSMHIYRPILKRLKLEGISATENSKPLGK